MQQHEDKSRQLLCFLAPQAFLILCSGSVLVFVCVKYIYIRFVVSHSTSFCSLTTRNYLCTAVSTNITTHVFPQDGYISCLATVCVVVFFSAASPRDSLHPSVSTWTGSRNCSSPRFGTRTACPAEPSLPPSPPPPSNRGNGPSPSRR